MVIYTHRGTIGIPKKGRNIMTIATEIKLRDFKFWSGAANTRMYLTDDEVDMIEAALEEDTEGKPMTDTELNDLFWFDMDYIAEILGYEDWDTMFNTKGRWVEKGE